MIVLDGRLTSPNCFIISKNVNSNESLCCWIQFPRKGVKIVEKDNNQTRREKKNCQPENLSNAVKVWRRVTNVVAQNSRALWWIVLFLGAVARCNCRYKKPFSVHFRWERSRKRMSIVSQKRPRPLLYTEGKKTGIEYVASEFTSATIVQSSSSA